MAFLAAQQDQFAAASFARPDGDDDSTARKPIDPLSDASFDHGSEVSTVTNVQLGIY